MISLVRLMIVKAVQGSYFNNNIQLHANCGK